MSRPIGWMLTSVVCLPLVASVAASDHDRQEQRKTAPVAGKGNVILPLPDLTVIGSFKLRPNSPCENGSIVLLLEAKIRNKGGPAVLASNWTKPWVTAYPSVSVAGFVKPYQTGAKTVSLNGGDEVVVQLSNAVLPRPSGGGGYQLIFEVDPSNTIKETDEANNKDKLLVDPNIWKICG